MAGKSQENILDYGDIKKPLTELITAMLNMIKTEWPQEYRNLGAAQTIFFMWVKMISITYNGIVFLSQEKLEKDPSKLELCLNISTLVRTIYDAIFNIIYISEDIQVRTIDYWKSGWRDIMLMNNDIKKYFKSSQMKPEEAEALRIYEEKTLAMHKRLINIAPEEEQNPKQKITPWPLAGTIKDKINDSNSAKEFLSFLYKCYQKQLGAHSHLSWIGLAERAFFFEDIVNSEEKSSILLRYKLNWMLLAITFLLALLSEINVFLDFKRNQDLINLWFIIKTLSADAVEFYDMRYKSLLKIHTNR